MLDILTKYVPPKAIDYCFQLWRKYDFSFVVTKSRSSKLGDYCHRREIGHKITVNHDLPPEAFLITYLHEVAHCATAVQYIRRKAPHGKEWKQNFRKILEPMLDEKVFSAEVLLALRAYIANPTAATNAFKPLREALDRKYGNMEEEKEGEVAVNQLEMGGLFELKKRIFRLGERRRTRIFCTDLKTNKIYTISDRAMVKPVKNQT